MKRFRMILRVGICIVPTILFAALAGGLGLALRHERNHADALQARLSAPNGSPQASGATPIYEPVTVDHHYALSGYKILLKDDTYGEIWIPQLADVPLSTHPNERLKSVNQRMTSSDENGFLNAMTGLDLSSYNQVTDWNAVKADGIDFVMLRVGYRTYGGGVIRADDAFANNYQAAKQAGLLVGAYFFSQAINEKEAEEEAIFIAQKLQGKSLDFPVVFDWEIIYQDEDGVRTDAIGVDTLTNCCLTFCQNIASFGYQPMIYQNKRTALWKLDLPRLQMYPFWLAEYGDGPTYVYDYDMWQYNCTGTVNGISGAVDMNLSFYDYSKAGAPAVTSTTPAPITADTTPSAGTGTTVSG